MILKDHFKYRKISIYIDFFLKIVLFFQILEVRRKNTGIVLHPNTFDGKLYVNGVSTKNSGEICGCVEVSVVTLERI